MSDKKELRAAVIGSGFGGLAAAIRLQAHGIKTVIFEKRDLPGGRAYVYRDQGFTFDAGPTVITAPHCNEELFHVAGRPMSAYVELLPVHPFYRLHWEDGLRFDYSNDSDELLRQIQKLSPPDVEGYRKFLRYSEDVFRQGYEKLVSVPFLNWWDMVRVSPQLLRLSAYRSVYQSVSRFIQEPHLRQAFSFHSLLIGGNPFTSSSIYTLIHYLERKWGVFFPRGGTGRLVEGLVRLFKDRGGTLRLKSPVRSIATQGGRVRGVVTREGRFESFDIVVSNADVVHTYRELLKEEPLLRRKAKKISQMAHSMSLFLIYFGTRKKFPHLAHHNVLFGPRYREHLQDIFYNGVLAEDFSLYLHVPSVSDPSLAPAGGETFYVLSPVPHLGKLAVDWKTEGPRYARKILDYLEARYLPGLSQVLVVKRIFTPEDFRAELNAYQGSAFSLEPTLTQSAFFRTHNRDARVKGLYFVGAGTHPGAGIPGVINSAKATAGLVFGDYGLGAAEEPKAELLYA